jgi:hypothetical protein
MFRISYLVVSLVLSFLATKKEQKTKRRLGVRRWSSRREEEFKVLRRHVSA